MMKGDHGPTKLLLDGLSNWFYLSRAICTDLAKLGIGGVLSILTNCST